MKPKRIILVRHGESVGNVNKDIYREVPDHSLPLTEEGMLQAVAAGKQLRELVGRETVHFWISPYLRTQATFEGIAKSFSRRQVHRVYEDFALREQDWGHFREREATSKLEQERDKYGALFYRFPNGDNVADVMDRSGDVINSMWRDFHAPDYTVDNLIVVTHGRTMRAFVSRWFHYSTEYADEMANPKNCEIWVMERDTSRENTFFEMKTKPRMHKEVPPHRDWMSAFPE